jgi:hypothetical protein
MMPDRRKITFAQAEGVEPLPKPLKLKEISQELRALLWGLIYDSMEEDCDRRTGHIVGAWYAIVRHKHVFFDHKMLDDFSRNFDSNKNVVRSVIEHGDYVQVFDLLQYVLRHQSCPDGLAEGISAVLEQARAAYRLVDGDTIVPAVTEEEADAVQRAFADLLAGELHGARSHLRKASDAINSGHYADSVRESIHAVESVARSLDPKAGKTLEPALAALESKSVLHPALKQGFSKIYGYTNDEQGIRHALIDDAAADVDIHDAVFMLGACASFITYLIGNARDAGIDLMSNGS